MASREGDPPDGDGELTAEQVRDGRSEYTTWRRVRDGNGYAPHLTGDPTGLKERLRKLAEKLIEDTKFQ
jgi:hypothetical protein